MDKITMYFGIATIMSIITWGLVSSILLYKGNKKLEDTDNNEFQEEFVNVTNQINKYRIIFYIVFFVLMIITVYRILLLN